MKNRSLAMAETKITSLEYSILVLRGDMKLIFWGDMKNRSLGLAETKITSLEYPI